MPPYALALGFVCMLLGIAGIGFDVLPLGFANWTLWFLGSAALMAGGLWSAMRFTPVPDQMLRNGAIPVRVRPRPKLTVIQGGKGRRRG